MDAEEIAEMVKELKITRETGGSAIVISEEGEKRGYERWARTVVGKIFARRQVNKELIKNHVPKILRTRGGMEIEIIGYNLFVIAFTLETDKRVALEDGPWHFFQDLMLFTETNPMQSVAEVEFKNISMWIQCHNVPIACMEPNVLKRIGDQVGQVEEIDMDEGGISLGRTIRMRVTRNLDSPLIRFVPVNNATGEVDTLVIIQYEKLPHFCFACGRVGHILKDCDDEKADKTMLRFDQRLRAGQGAHNLGPRGWGGGQGFRGGSKGLEGVGVNKRASKGESSEEVGGSGEVGRDKAIVAVNLEKGQEESEGETMGVDKMDAEEIVIGERGGFGEAFKDALVLEVEGKEEAERVEPLISTDSQKARERWKRRAREQSSMTRERGEIGREGGFGQMEGPGG